ncbi:retrovirus-related pol polyprotein from transposon TNT 1-94 [Tanacetum coccineum]
MIRKDDEPTKKSGKRRKQMARKGLHTSVDKNDSEDSEQDDSVTGTKTPINPVPVAMKTPSIATYKIIKQGEKGVYQIVREDGTDIVYINFGAMMKSISRDDLTELYRIVMNRYGMNGPEDKLERPTDLKLEIYESLIMDNTRAQQKALDDELVAPTNRLKIGKSNLRLSSNLKSKEPTLQVVLDALKLTPFYKAFEITADVPDIYMQEFWITISRHHSLLRFKLNGKSHTVNIDNFRDMLKIYPKLPGQIFEEPPLEEEILYFIRDLGHTGETKFLSDVNVNHMHQPWRSFAAIINKCLSRKTTAMESLCLSRTQILWGMYHNKTTATTAKGKRLKTSAKAAKPAKKKQPAKTSKAKGLTVLSEVALIEAEQMKLATKRSLIETHSSHISGSSVDKGTGSKLGVPNVLTYRSDDEQISWKSSDEEDDDEVGLNDDDDDNDDDEDNDDYDDVADNQDDDDQEDDGQDDEDQDDVNKQTDSDNDGDDFLHPKLSTQDQEVRHNEENAQPTNVQTTQVIEDTHVIITPVNPDGKQQSSSVSSGFVSNMLNPSPDIGIDSIFNLNIESTSLIDVPVTTISEPLLLSTTTLPPPPTPLITHLQQTPVPTPVFNQTNQFVLAVSSIPGILDTYLANKMNEAVKIAVQLQSDILRDEAQAENEEFLNKLDDNIKKIIKDQVKEQTSHDVAANLSELELKKILIDKMESNKSIHRSDEQKNLYKVLVDTYESDKLILDTYGDNVSFKRPGKEPKSTSAPKEKTSKTTGKSTKGSKSYYKSASESAQAEEPRHAAKDLEEPAHLEFKIGVTKDQPNEKTSQLPDWFQKPAKPLTPDRDWNKTLPNAHGPLQPWLRSLAQMEDPHKSFNELMDIPLDFSAFVMNRLKVDTLTPELLAGPTFKLMESARDVYSKRRIIAVTKLQIVKWHNYKHLDWITVRRDDDKLYKFKEGDFNRHHIQDIKDMLLLLVQGKLTDLTIEECLAFNVSLRILDVKRREAYTSYSNPRGFIYQNKDKKNRLMHIDELHKFSDGTLNDVWTALDDRLKGIRMKYMPQTIWRQSDRDKVGAMIQAINKQLKTRRIMRSLEKLVGGRPYEGDFRLLQRTI